MEVRRLKDLVGYFDKIDGYNLDTIIYTVNNVEQESEVSNEFNYGFTTIMPGDINGEYYMTKGHIHSKAETAEVYLGLEGTGIILVDDELREIKPGTVCYVEPYKSHRAINTGDSPLKFFCVYRADAGHDYNIKFNKRIKKND